MEENVSKNKKTHLLPQAEKKIKKGFPTPEREQTVDWEYEWSKSEHERDIERHLLPCPFCGSPVSLTALEPAYQDGSFDAYGITCTSEVDCGFYYLFDDDSPMRLIEFWNHRASAKQE